ncbi:hypothetical protein GOODEAATRI_000717 [Goodea atripinnis]|uniref:Uncharacterized protein n=1 Tax=Goodea atripinnis TaxID=208336 RepID=A0ABV0MDX8_9TELE
MTEPKTDKDEEYCRKVNDYLNNPPIPGGPGSGGGSGHELSALGGEGSLQNLLGNMSHNQLMQLIGPTGLGGLAPAQTPVAPASVGSPPPHQPIQLSDLQSILANMNVPAAAAQGPAGNVRICPVKALHVRAALSPDGSLYRERFGQHDRSTVDANMAETAVESRKTVRVLGH